MTKRHSGGASLIELLIAVFLMSFVSAAIFGLATLNNTQGTKIFNKIDTLNAAREVIDMIGEDVRMARSIGDLYGGVIPPTNQVITNGTIVHASTNTSAFTPVNSATLAMVYNGSETESSNTFPATGDPIYNLAAGLTPSGGWPAFPGNGTATGAAGPPYTLGPATLIIQTPIFDLPGAGGNNAYPGGFPALLYVPTQAQLTNQLPNTQGNASNQPTLGLESVDTYVFQVIPDNTFDPSAPANTYYQLQVAGFPGCGQGPNGSVAFSSMLINSTPRTLLRGIVGPLDSNGNICIFQYIDKSTPGVPETSVPFNRISDVSGVIVALEVKRLTSVNGSGSSSFSVGSIQEKGATVVAFKSEMYMRNNALATVVNQ